MSLADTCEVRVVDAVLVDRVKADLPEPESIAQMADVFALLGDGNRVRMLASLCQAPELCVCDLAATTEMSESATSHALRLLRAHGVVKVRRSGRIAYYSLHDDHVRTLLDVALTHVSHGATDG